jgi:hypothetical protein
LIDVLFSGEQFNTKGRIGISALHYIIYYITLITLHYPGKGKAIPLQAWTGPEGSRRLRLPDFKTVGT